MVRCWSIPLILFGFFLSLSAYGGKVAPAPPSDDDLDAFEQELNGSRPLFAVGLYDLYGVSHQGGRSFTTNDSVQYQTSAYDGSINEQGLFFDYQYSERWAVRVFAGYQTTKQHGSATQVGIPAPSQIVEVDESLLAVGCEFKYFPIQELDLWGAFGLEFDHGLSVKLSLGGLSVPTFSEDNPNLIQFLAGFGYDFKIKMMTNWLISPEFRISDAFATKPSILSYEGAIGFGWLF